jgi:hypothetical protein
MLNPGTMEKKIEKRNGGFKESTPQTKSKSEALLPEPNAFYIISAEDHKKKKWDPTALYF